MFLHGRQNPLTNKFTINGHPFVDPKVPVLLQILSGARNPSDLLPKGSIYGLERYKSVELVIPGGAVGGPVSIGAFEWYDSNIVIDCRINSILFIYTGIISMWFGAQGASCTTSMTLLFEMS
jgi:hypothetical protein